MLVPHHTIAAALIALAACGSSYSQPPSSTTAELERRVEALQSKLESQEARIGQQEAELVALRQQSHTDWMDAARRRQVAEMVREVLADADTRASLLEGSINAGWKNGFFIASDDGSHKLTIGGMIQGRYTHGFMNNSNANTSASALPDDSRGGFGISRTRFSFSGHIIDPSWTFLFLAGYDCSGKAVVLDAAITKDLGEGWSVTIGQFKLPYMYEYLVSEKHLQFIDRSLLAGEFCGTYTQGIMVTHQTDNYRLRLSFNDGFAAINTIWHTTDVEYAFSGRAELKLAGGWDQYIDWTAWTDKPTMFVIGAAFHVQEGEYGDATGPEVFNVRWTADASLEINRLNLFAAVIANHAEQAGFGTQWGALVQGGYFITPTIEVIGRYEWGDSDIAGEDDLSILTVGFNYFISGHRLKVGTDVGYSFNAVSATFFSNPLGWRMDTPGESGQIVIRSQLQLLF